jgi:hypothetical protein
MKKQHYSTTTTNADRASGTATTLNKNETWTQQVTITIQQVITQLSSWLTTTLITIRQLPVWWLALGGLLTLLVCYFAWVIFFTDIRTKERKKRRSTISAAFFGAKKGDDFATEILDWLLWGNQPSSGDTSQV